MTNAPETTEKWAWWKANELRINLIAALICLVLLAVGILLNLGVMAGISFLLLIFFATYTVYAYVRRNF
jgi:ABC-type nickel/cobalt efflux system permease component RcnA